ncbi:hypothetical protein ACVI9W_003278 [Pseudomonas sp. 210_17 TE3656]
MELAARFSPAGIEGIAGHCELRRLLAQLGLPVDGITERGILFATLLGQVIVAPQLLPQTRAHLVDRQQIDLLEAQACCQRRFVERFAGRKGLGKTKNLGPRGDIEQRRAVELLWPVAAVEGCRRHRRGLHRSTQQSGQ